MNYRLTSQMTDTPNNNQTKPSQLTSRTGHTKIKHEQFLDKLQKN